eukprot:CCRYP_004639-RA/>CCRYP_004639-RA protein AED:0.41 eAED:0.32 QI:0/0/0/0.66/1/1/3/0/424
MTLLGYFGHPLAGALDPDHPTSWFNPALAGTNLLLVEWFDWILTLAPPLQRSVSINITAASTNLHSFPVLLESAFTSCPTITTPPLIVDTGASCCITTCKDDFISYAPSAAKIRDLSGINTVAGEGLLCWHVLDYQGREHAIELKGYHIPNALVRLLSPQAMFPSLGGHGHSSSCNGYTCGTIYVDHCSTFIYIHHQLTTAASDTICGKMLLESEAADVGVTIRQFHSDNGVFSSKEFREHCTCFGQTLHFSGVGAHHQNAVTKRATQTVTNMARANMLHATLHWPDLSFIDLWPLAMNYAVWAYNKLPQHGAGLSPEELFSGIKCPRSHLPRAHVFDCPVYVLDPCLQDGKKIPKWESRARQGIFVGFSLHHSTSVALILNPRTQHISPQFHVIFDDAFTTVPSLTNESEQDHRFEQLFSTSR